MKRFSAVLIDQVLLSLASYLFILNIVTNVEDVQAVTMLQLISVTMITYPILNGIMCFRIVEEASKITRFSRKEIRNAILMLGGIIGVLFVWFGATSLLSIGIFLLAANSVQHVFRMSVLANKNSVALLVGSGCLFATVALSVAFEIFPQTPIGFLMPIVLGRLFYGLIAYWCIRDRVEVALEAEKREIDVPRTLAAMAQYARTNWLFLLFSFISPASAAVELRILELCLAPIRQFAISFQNFAIAHKFTSRKVFTWSSVAACGLPFFAIALYFFLDTGTSYFWFSSLILFAVVVSVVFSTSFTIILRQKKAHSDMWKLIFGTLVVMAPVAVLLSQFSIYASVSLLLFELLILAVLSANFIFKKGFTR